MAVELSIGNLEKIAEGVWETRITPREIRGLGTCNQDAGTVSIVMIKAPRVSGTRVTFALHDAIVLNVGVSDRALVIAADSARANVAMAIDGPSARNDPVSFSVGDRQFLSALDELPDEVRRAGVAILTAVRQRFPGTLSEVTARRFQETPDNFWFVVIQPRDQSLRIVVRGLPDRFTTSRLKLIEDRRPYSTFKVRGLADVSEAVAVIGNAIRKRG